ncbi:MAG: DUF167 domain-containing protein [Opitutaceae bacterium]
METCRLTIRAVPGARRNAVDGPLGEAIKIRLKAPAVDGKANRALLAFLAECLHLRSRDLRLVSGETSRLKIIEVRGIGETAARKSLLEAT